MGGGTVLSHTPFLVALCKRFISWPPASSFRLSSSTISTCFRSFLAPALALRTHAPWPTWLRAEPPRRECTSSPLVAFEVLYALSADNRGSGITNLPCLTLWPWVYQYLALISSPPNSAEKNFSLRDSSIGPIRVPTPGTVLCRYCHSICNDIPRPA